MVVTDESYDMAEIGEPEEIRWFSYNDNIREKDVRFITEISTT